MTETPREYKKRIDEQREKRRINRDKLIQQIENYELVDENYKAKIKQEILSNFEENEKAEKNNELYIKIGEELQSLETKYQELKALKEKFESKKQEESDLKKQLMNQDIDGTDETTLKIQMNNIKKLNTKLEGIEKEVEELEKEIQNREQELKEIEETYGKKADTAISNSTESNVEEKSSKNSSSLGFVEEKPTTLKGYKEKVLEKKFKINRTRREIIKLLDEGIGIDDSLKEKIKGEIIEVFEKYNDEIEGNLRMKSARYMEYREGMLDDMGYGKERKSQLIGGKLLIQEKKSDGKYRVTWGDKQLGEDFDNIYSLQGMGGKPVFEAKKNRKSCVMRGEDQLGDWFSTVSRDIQCVGGKPAFQAMKMGEYCVMRGNEQIGDWHKDFKTYDEIVDFINKYNEEQKENIAENEKNDSSKIMEENKSENISEELLQTPREKREKVILDRYQKKLNRDELLKVISRCECMDKETKKKLEIEILHDFYDEFKKATSTPEYQERDKQYRELKKSERQKGKKSVELELQKEKSKLEVVKLDEKLFEIANSAMKLEDDSRLKIVKSNKLKKAKEEWNTLKNRLNEILDKVMKIHNEEIKWISIYSEKEKKYGKKSERSRIKGKVLSKNTVTIEKLAEKSTFLGHKKAYMELIKDKEKYIEELIQQISPIDFGISEEKKKEVIEVLKTTLEKDLEVFKQGDEITKMTEETEKWLEENRKTTLEKINELKGKIQEKESEISLLKSKGKGDSRKEIFQIKEKEFKLRNELLAIKNEYESIKSEVDEKLKRYDGISIDWTKDLVVETWKDRIKRIQQEERERIQQEEREMKRKEQEKIDKDKANEILKPYRELWRMRLSISDSLEKTIISSAEKIPVSINIEPDGSRLIEINLGGKRYKILDVNLESESDMYKFGSYDYNGKSRLGVSLSGIKGKSIDKRDNEKLKEYIKQQKIMGFDIPSKELQEQILSELKECSEYNFNVSEQLLLWMYLTGLHGCYLLKEGDFIWFGLRQYKFSDYSDVEGKISIYLVSSE